MHNFIFFYSQPFFNFTISLHFLPFELPAFDQPLDEPPLPNFPNVAVHATTQASKQMNT
jgi:hypothetical protein